ncbi:hypothetical protein [Nitrospira sp. Kam-Ns4a]
MPRSTPAISPPRTPWTPGHGFNCVRDPQIFPQGPQDTGETDRTGYEDNDSLYQFK